MNLIKNMYKTVFIFKDLDTAETDITFQNNWAVIVKETGILNRSINNERKTSVELTADKEEGQHCLPLLLKMYILS